MYGPLNIKFYEIVLGRCLMVFEAYIFFQIHIKGISNMTGIVTGLFTLKSVPVIFEPPCISQINSVQNVFSITFVFTTTSTTSTTRTYNLVLTFFFHSRLFTPGKTLRRCLTEEPENAYWRLRLSYTTTVIVPRQHRRRPNKPR